MAETSSNSPAHSNRETFEAPITYFESRNNPLTKSYSEVDGKLKKGKPPLMYEALGQTLSLNADRMRDIISTNSYYFSISTDIEKQERTNYNIRTKKEIANHEAHGTLPPDTISRTKDNFKYPEDNCWFPIDNDPNDNLPLYNSAEAFMRAIVAVMPEFKDCLHISKASGSACVHLEKETPNLTGWHIYIAATNGEVKAEAAKEISYRLKQTGVVDHNNKTLTSVPGIENLHVDGDEKGTFIYCFSSPSSGRIQDLPTRFGRYIVRIKDPEALFQDVQNAIHDDPRLNEFKLELSHEMVRCDKEAYQKSVTEKEMDTLGWAQKPKRYADEFEYRYRFGLFYHELIGSPKHYTVKIDRGLGYCDLIRRMQFKN